MTRRLSGSLRSSQALRRISSVASSRLRPQFCEACASNPVSHSPPVQLQLNQSTQVKRIAERRCGWDQWAVFSKMPKRSFGEARPQGELGTEVQRLDPDIRSAI